MQPGSVTGSSSSLSFQKERLLGIQRKRTPDALRKPVNLGSNPSDPILQSKIGLAETSRKYDFPRCPISTKKLLSVQIIEQVLNKMNKISEDYICGFFDGEGHVDFRRKQLVLSNTNLSGLKRISKFLNESGIKNKISEFDSKISNHSKIYRLKIHGYHNLVNYYKLIGFGFDTKSNDFQSLINSYKNIPLSNEERIKVKKLRNTGLSFRKIAKICGGSKSNIHRICNLKNE